MRYSASHKQETRERLLQSSAAQAKNEGFSTVGVDALMKAIGLSGGAFYSHFTSKDELFSSIVERELSQSLARLGGEGQQNPEDQQGEASPRVKEHASLDFFGPLCPLSFQRMEVVLVVSLM